MTKLAFDNFDGDIFFRCCRYDGTLQDGRHPFTGEPIKVPHNAPLSASERAAVEALFQRAREPGGASNVVRVPDGGTALVDIYESSANVKPFKVRPTPGLAALLHEALLAGNWCIQSDDAFVVAHPDHARPVPKEDPRVPAEFYQAIPKKVVVLESAAELAAALGWTNARASS